ncbi:E3 ubiquitin-protein ligase TRIM7-like isoform X2 [Thamnophis elegans]|uniref:E3 ubiquitin-protein ligase TRIM7-like isoform X2 n=1 Tax=Thamnophis elegans TaxID=35005 RepID=UPI0013765A84|nr:E3 ubiquitin-protein ligase TRIM7-like isoform X2 [Thamnophis elegans]
MASTSLEPPERKDDFCDQCSKYLTDPISIECGHTFCRPCITEHYRERKKEGLFFCPVCEEPIPEGRLRRILQQPGVEDRPRLLPEKTFVCPKHKMVLDLFCQEDEKLICAVCQKAMEHKTHTVISPKQAAQPLKDQIRSRIILLEEKKDIMESHPSDAEKEIAELLGQMEEEKEKLDNVFKQLHDFLRKQEKQLQNRMKMVEKDIQKTKVEYLEGLSKERNVLKSIIREMQEVRELPAVEFLMDFKANMQRYDKALENSVVFPLELKWRSWDFCDINPFLENSGNIFNAHVFLDPDTAHPRLILADDCKSLKMGEFYQPLAKTPERFDEWPFVLACSGFTTGRHFWEVTVGTEDTWGVGVARKSVRRKGDIEFCPEEGFWAVGKWDGNYTAYNPPFYTPLTLRRMPKKIRIVLNYEGGWVTFFDADTGAPLFAFSPPPFIGEVIIPLFYVFGNARLSIAH